MSDVAPSVGTLLASRYRLVELLGQGGMGSVWRADHLTLGAPVAVKLMNRAVEHDTDAAARFKREAQAAAALRSPYVVQIMDFGIDDGTPYLVMELLEGESLRARLNRTGRLCAADTLKIVTEASRALTKAHRLGIVHRDIKPDNIFITRAEHEEITKLLDFGVAKVASSGSGVEALTRAGAVLGTAQYMSPEQIEGRAVDARTDLWALAVVAYECLVGRPAFDATSLGELALQICVRPLPVPSHVARVPAGFDAWFARATEREPERRFASALELSDALARALDAGPARDTQPALAATLAAPAKPVVPTKPGSSTTGGSERAGFEVSYDRATAMLRMRLWGMWDLAVAREFQAVMLRAFDELRERPWVWLGDGTKYPPQNERVQAIHTEMMATAVGRNMARGAIVVSGALEQLQPQRLFNDIELRFFGSESAARAWLGR